MNITFPRSENRATLTDPIEFRAVEKKRRILCKVSHATLHWANPETAGKETISETPGCCYVNSADSFASRHVEAFNY